MSTSETVEGLCGNLKELNLQQSNENGAETPQKVIKEKKEEAREENGGDGDIDPEERKGYEYNAFKENTTPTVATPIDDELLVAKYGAKLYRFDNTTKQWKEKGVGNITILQSMENYKKCRVVMWTRVTGKIACNFSLFPEMSITSYQKSPKILCWKVLDLTDDEPRWETFTCRFLTEEECSDFKNNVLKYAKDPPEIPVSESTSESETDDCDKSECPGCVGCDPETYEFRKPAEVEVTEKTKEPPIDIPLASDSCKDVPCLVEPAMFKCL